MSLSKNDIKKRLEINTWLDLDSSDRFGKYLRLYPDIRKGIHLTIIGDLPNYIARVNDFITAEIKKAPTSQANLEVINILTRTVDYLSELMSKDLTAKEQQELVDLVGTAVTLVKSLETDVKALGKPIALNMRKLQPSMGKLQPFIAKLRPSIEKLQSSIKKLQPSTGKLQNSTDIIKNACLTVGAVILIIGAFIFRINLTEETED